MVSQFDQQMQIASTVRMLNETRAEIRKVAQQYEIARARLMELREHEERGVRVLEKLLGVESAEL